MGCSNLCGHIHNQHGTTHLPIPYLCTQHGSTSLHNRQGTTHFGHVHCGQSVIFSAIYIYIIYIHTHTHTYIYIYTYLCISLSLSLPLLNRLFVFLYGGFHKWGYPCSSSILDWEFFNYKPSSYGEIGYPYFQKPHISVAVFESVASNCLRN